MDFLHASLAPWRAFEMGRYRMTVFKKTMRLSAFAMAAALICGVSAGSARASVIYTLTASGSSGFGAATTFGFTYTAPAFITGDTLGVTPGTCSIGDGSAFTCNTMDFDVSTNQFAGTDDLLVFGSHQIGGSDSTGFLFFQAGAFGAAGVYSNSGYPQNTPGFGNFAQATLTVEVAAVPLPAALPLLAGGLGVLGLVARRRNRKGFGARA